jgi:hypothetical protein
MRRFFSSTDILPTGYAAIEWSKMTGGETVAVFGCGPVGLVAQKVAWLKGAKRVIGVALQLLAGAIRTGTVLQHSITPRGRRRGRERSAYRLWPFPLTRASQRQSRITGMSSPLARI